MEEKQLIFEITESRMSAFALENGQLSEIAALECTSRTDAAYRNTLQELLAKCGNPDDYTSYSCSYSNGKQVLVPMSLFAETTSEELLRLAFQSGVSRDDCDYNRLPEWSMVNAFYLPMWIKSVLIVRIPRVVIQHELTHLLRQLNTGSLIPLRTHVILQETHFCCVIRKNGNIVHASYQEYQSPEDVLYHLLYCFKNDGIEGKGEIFLHSSTEKALAAARQIAQMAGSVSEIQSQKTETLFREHIKFQQLCV
jgi:hypothetical protein